MQPTVNKFSLLNHYETADFADYAGTIVNRQSSIINCCLPTKVSDNPALRESTRYLLCR